MIIEADIASVGALIARKFIARPDVIAEQYKRGDDVLWVPRKVRWTADRMSEHLRGTKTYGHYVSSQENSCKVVTFDIDWMAKGLLPALPMDHEESLNLDRWTQGNPRAEWRDRQSVCRPWMQYNLRTCAHYLYYVLKDEFGIESAVAYSGNKGLHVYGFFPKLVDLQVARQVGVAALEASGGLWAKNGVPYESTLLHPLKGTMGLSIELFPKQDRVDDGFGNLVRLPLGKNLKSSDPTFFVDMTAPHSKLMPLDPKIALGLI